MYELLAKFFLNEMIILRPYWSEQVCMYCVVKHNMFYVLKILKHFKTLIFFFNTIIMLQIKNVKL